jgi:hypothetical protein
MEKQFGMNMVWVNDAGVESVEVIKGPLLAVRLRCTGWFCISTQKNFDAHNV